MSQKTNEIRCQWIFDCYVLCQQLCGLPRSLLRAFPHEVKREYNHILISCTVWPTWSKWTLTVETFIWSPPQVLESQCWAMDTLNIECRGPLIICWHSPESVWIQSTQAPAWPGGRALASNEPNSQCCTEVTVTHFHLTWFWVAPRSNFRMFNSQNCSLQLSKCSKLCLVLAWFLFSLILLLDITAIVTMFVTHG